MRTSFARGSSNGDRRPLPNLLRCLCNTKHHASGPQSRTTLRALSYAGCFFHSCFPFEINNTTLQSPCSGYRFLLLALKLGRCSRGTHPNSKLNQSLWGNPCSPLSPRGVFKHRKPALITLALAQHCQHAPKQLRPLCTSGPPHRWGHAAVLKQGVQVKFQERGDSC